MEVRSYKTKLDYPYLVQWWKAYKDWIPIEEDFLPETGIMILEQGIPICAGFIYTSNSKLAWLEWIVADPTSDFQVRDDCLGVLLDELIKLAGELGAKAIFSAVKHERMIKRYGKVGFLKTDSGMSHFIRRIK
jgi:hypothetical protein